MPAPRATRSRIVTVVEPVVAAAGFDLEEVAVNQAGRRTVVRVVIDADGGVTLDDIAEVSRSVSAALDDLEGAGGNGTGSRSVVGTGPYTLEITSPGVDRPLTEVRHWRRNVGRLVTVRVGDRTVTARVVAADEGEVTLDDGSGPRAVRHAELGPGRVQVEFGRPTERGDDRGQARSGRKAGRPGRAAEGNDVEGDAQ